MTKKKDEKPRPQFDLSVFLNDISLNIGYSLNKKNSKSVFDPFKMSNAESVLLLYNLLKSYSTNTKKDMPIPKEITSQTADKKVLFIFKDDLDISVITDIIDKKELRDISVNEKNIIEVSKVKKK
jgi:hypothetical protein